MSAVHALLNRVSRLAAQITGVVTVVLCTCLVGSLLVSIFFRYVVGSALSWPEEIALILFAWLVLLAGSLGVREGFHVRLSLLTGRFPMGVQRVLDRMVTAAVGLFGGVLVYSGADLVDRTARHLTPTLRLPLDWVNYSAVVCGILICLHALALLFKPAAGRP